MDWKVSDVIRCLHGIVSSRVEYSIALNEFKNMQAKYGGSTFTFAFMYMLDI